MDQQRRPLLGCMCEAPSAVRMAAAVVTTGNWKTGAYTSALFGTWMEESAVGLGVSEEFDGEA